MDLAHLKKIRILLIFTSVFLINCNHKSSQGNEIDQTNEIDQWDEIKINPSRNFLNVRRTGLLDEKNE
jgi:hypothetical protein